MANNMMNNMSNMGFNPYMNKRVNRERLLRQREDIDMMLNNMDMEQPMQQTPVNNIINAQQPPQNNSSMYLMKVLNDNDEAENIFVDENTIFIGTDKMQIKKLDGTIEKYEIKRYYPVDVKDQKIEELTLHLIEQNEKIDQLTQEINKLKQNCL